MTERSVVKPKLISALVGRRIRALRTTAAIPLTQFASEIGMPEQRLKMIESGFVVVSAGELYEMAGILSCSVSDFYVIDENSRDYVDLEKCSNLKTQISLLLEKIDDLDTLEMLYTFLNQISIQQSA